MITRTVVKCRIRLDDMPSSRPIITDSVMYICISCHPSVMLTYWPHKRDWDYIRLSQCHTLNFCRDLIPLCNVYVVVNNIGILKNPLGTQETKRSQLCPHLWPSAFIYFNSDKHVCNSLLWCHPHIFLRKSSSFVMIADLNPPWV